MRTLFIKCGLRSSSEPARNRYCDRELGEEIGWRVSPFKSGFLEGYQATHDTKWLDLLVDWGDSWIAGGVQEPDGFTGFRRPLGGSGSSRRDLAHDHRSQPQPRELGGAELLAVVSGADEGEVIEDPIGPAWCPTTRAR